MLRSRAHPRPFSVIIILNSANDITGVDFPIDSKVR